MVFLQVFRLLRFSFWRSNFIIHQIILWFPGETISDSFPALALRVCLTGTSLCSNGAGWKRPCCRSRCNWASSPWPVPRSNWVTWDQKFLLEALERQRFGKFILSAGFLKTLLSQVGMNMDIGYGSLTIVWRPLSVLQTCFGFSGNAGNICSPLQHPEVRYRGVPQ